MFINVVKEILIPNLKKIVDNTEQKAKIEVWFDDQRHKNIAKKNDSQLIELLILFTIFISLTTDKFSIVNLFFLI